MDLTKDLIKVLSLPVIGVFNSSAQLLEIPFEIKNDIALIEVQINDNPYTNTFLFDTGATSDVLDSRVADPLGLKANYKQDVPGAGGTTTFDIVRTKTLSLATVFPWQHGQLGVTIQ